MTDRASFPETHVRAMVAPLQEIVIHIMIFGFVILSFSFTGSKIGISSASTSNQLLFYYSTYDFLSPEHEDLLFPFWLKLF